MHRCLRPGVRRLYFPMQSLGCVVLAFLTLARDTDIRVDAV